MLKLGRVDLRHRRDRSHLNIKIGAIIQEGLQDLALQFASGWDPNFHALTLISMSGKQASAKLQFARLAYGASTTSGDSLDFGEVRQVIDTLFEGGKVKVHWNVQTHTVGRSFVKILANLVLIAADCIPRGGSLTVHITDQDGRQTLKISSEGDRAKLNEDVGRALKDELEGEELNPRSIQPFLTGLLAREEGLRIEDRCEENAVTFLVNAD